MMGVESSVFDQNLSSAVVSVHNKPKKPSDIAYLDVSIGGAEKGRLMIKLFTDVVPNTCNNFISLCKGPFKACVFHRIIKDFMAQGGDMKRKRDRRDNSNSSMSESPQDNLIEIERFKDENFRLKHSERGLLSMANSGPNTNTSQFFITFAACQHLDGKHVVFGKVVEGFDLLNQMEEVSTQTTDEPVAGQEVVITDCGIVDVDDEATQQRFEGVKGDEVTNETSSSSSSASSSETSSSTSASEETLLAAEVVCDFSDMSTSKNCEFRPALFFQQVSKWHVATRALDIKMNLSTGVHVAKFGATGINLEAGPKERLLEAIENQTKLVSAGKGVEDTNNVKTLLKNASTWNNKSMVEYIIRTCYVTECAALPALEEASSMGFDAVVSVLLKAGVCPTNCSQGNETLKNSFMQACANGQEACASLLLAAMKNPTQPYLRSVHGHTAFDILRNNDMNGIARRLEAQAKAQFNL